jgi:flavin reductase (DIM6/NTAB) family NADH-FMN oxidoreductase RutF
MQHEKIRQAGDSAPDVAELRRVLGSFAIGVAVATTFDSKGIPKGSTANSFTSVSLNPPRRRHYGAYSICARIE